MLEKIPISDEFQSPLLSQACGAEVTITVPGSLRVLSFPNRPVGPQDLNIVNITVVATAGDKQITFKNVDMNMERVEPDGTAIFTIAGRKPVEFTGALKINVETRATIQEPRFRRHADLRAADG